MRKPRSVVWLWIGLILIASLALCVPLLGNAFFTLDDYRYLRELRDIDGGLPGAWSRAMVVENRWDQFWWIADGTYVRFFRPFLIFSYAVDRWLWGLWPTGFVITNLALHALTVVLFASCVVKMFGWGWAAGISVLAFATQCSHYENLYYIAGRTDTIAAIAFLLAIRAYLTVRERPSAKGQIGVALLCFLAFLCKEYTIVLPVLLVLLDRHQRRDGTAGPWTVVVRRGAWLYSACALLVVVFFVLRAIGLGEAGSGAKPYPYFFMPDRTGFADRAVAVSLQYGHELAFGGYVSTYLGSFEQLVARFTTEDPQLYIAPIELWLGTAWVAGLVIWGLLTRAGRWFAILFTVCVVPLIPLYTSARFLFLATIGYCALLGLWTSRRWTSERHASRAIALVVCVLFVGVPAYRLWMINDWLPARLAAPAPRGIIYTGLIERSGVRISVDRPLYLFDLPGSWYEAQFLPDAMPVILDRSLPPVRVITLYSYADPDNALRVRAVGERTLELDRNGAPLHDPDPALAFDAQLLEPGAVVERPGYRFEVVDAVDGRPVRALVHFDQGLAELGLVQFRRDQRGGWSAVSLGR